MLASRAVDRRPFLAVLVALVALAWLMLLAWERSPHGRLLSHDALGELPGVSGPEYPRLALAFVGGWTLMTVAMMLPTALPLLLLFRRLTARRRDATALVALLVVGYLGLWAGFGAVAHLGDLALHVAAGRSHWLQDRSWALGSGVLLLAGVYQFTPLKYFCLARCRSPFGFIVQHWHGRHARLEAFRLGVHHAVFCIGCCWSLMLLMFAVGVGNLGWMLALAGVMAVEKNLPWGRRISAPLGVVLIAAGAISAALYGAGVVCAHDGTAC